jgi:hypothetical protein
MGSFNGLPFFFKGQYLDGVRCPCCLALGDDEGDLGVCVGMKPVHSDDARDAEDFADVADVAADVGATLLKQLQVLRLVNFIQRPTSGNGWSTTVHLQRSDSSDDDATSRFMTARAALDVAEFLEPNVRAETSFRDHDALLADHAESDVVGDDRRVAVGDVREGATVDQNGGGLHGLHQRGHHRVLH